MLFFMNDQHFIVLYVLTSIVCIGSKMPKGKDQTGEPIQGGKDVLRWSEDMDQVLLNALCEEATKGNRHDGSWTTEAYSNVVEALCQHIGPHMTKQHIKNQMKTLKDHFAESYDLFNGLSGFAWNPSTKRFEAEKEVWEDLKRVSHNFFIKYFSSPLCC